MWWFEEEVGPLGEDGESGGTTKLFKTMLSLAGRSSLSEEGDFLLVGVDSGEGMKRRWGEVSMLLSRDPSVLGGKPSETKRCSPLM